MNNNIFKLSMVSLAIAMSSTAFAAGDASWGYEGHEAPEFWGDLSPAYELCKTGKEQSPIDFVSGTEKVRKSDELDTYYESAALNVQNNGHIKMMNK